MRKLSTESHVTDITLSNKTKLMLASMVVDRLPHSQSTFPEQKEGFIQAQVLHF